MTYSQSLHANWLLTDGIFGVSLQVQKLIGTPQLAVAYCYPIQLVLSFTKMPSLELIA